MKNKLVVISFFAFVVFTFSCKKTKIIQPYQYSDTSLYSVFQAFWHGMNDNYVFWSIDSTNWDNMYAVYMPKFVNLHINRPGDVVTAYKYFKLMTQGLIDGHYKISFYDTTLIDSIDSVIYPNHRKTNYALDTGYFKNLARKYLDDSGFYKITPYSELLGGKNSNMPFEILTGTMCQKKIVYLQLNEFHLENIIKNMDAEGDSCVDRIWHAFLNNLRNLDSRGVIVDLRSNIGGDLQDLNYVCGEMIDEPLNFGYTREKSGNGRFEYAPWVYAKVSPPKGAQAVTIPIVVLTDQHTESLAEQMTLAIKLFPKTRTYVIGDTTWGANGPLSTDSALYISGQFSFANFGYVYTSSAMFKALDGTIYEGKGIPPDHYIPVPEGVSKTDVLDNQMDAAINYLRIFF